MNPSLSRLRALQHQAGARSDRHLAPVASTRHSLRAPADVPELRRLLGLHDTGTTRRGHRDPDGAMPGDEIAPGVRLVESWQPAPGIPLRIAGAFDRRDDFNSDRALFFDTETTGLAGGTGTRAFMIGAAAWECGRLHVRQLLMTQLAAESAMLAEFARWTHPDTILVSYNGKCYDAPLLRTRYRLARLSDPTAGLAHIDLLHATRRRYHGVYENCRLATIERRVLRILREDDLPGSEAPRAWLTYLRNGSARDLRRVLEHNRQDVASLARLLLHLAA